MVLGIDQILKLVKEKNLVENLSKRELENPEGAGFDLRIGELYKMRGRGFLGIDERSTPNMELLARYEEGKVAKTSIQSGEYLVMKTVESVNMPENLLAIMTPRSTLFRSGVYVFGGQTPPGYKGGLTLGIYNMGKEPFDLEMGSRIVHIMFFEVKGKSNLYRGQWQGGRVTTAKKEKQV